MGRASNRKKHKRDERAAEARMLRIVVCAYPDKSLLPVLELLKAANVYGDEVVLHHPTATMLASVAAMGHLEPAELVGVTRTLPLHSASRGRFVRAGHGEDRVRSRRGSGRTAPLVPFSTPHLRCIKSSRCWTGPRQSRWLRPLATSVRSGRTSTM